MNFFDRFLLAIYSLGVMIALFILGFSVAGWTTPINMLQESLSNYENRIIIGTVTVVFIVISIRLLLHALSSPYRPAQAVVHETSMGQVRVSQEAVENIVSRVVNQIKGIREVSPRVVFTPEGIELLVRVSLLPETHIPRTSDEIQNTLNNYMTEVAGINIKSVKILVESISSELKSGTPRKLL